MNPASNRGIDSLVLIEKNLRGLISTNPGDHVESRELDLASRLVLKQRQGDR